jgi:putative redox protein
MTYQFRSDGLQLVGRLARPDRVGGQGVPAVVITHGFPTKTNGRLDAGRSYYDLAERIAEDLGWMALAFTYRGCGDSEGNFSLGGWLSDVHNAVAHLDERDDTSGVWVAGFGTGGALGIVAASTNPRIRGVAAISPPADFDDWVNEPADLMGYARQVGAIRDPDFPEDLAAWNDELANIRAVDAAGDMADRPLLIMHGADDDVVPVFDARVLADAHGSADLRIVSASGHRLRFDPRAIAVFLGWLDRVGRGHDSAAETSSDDAVDATGDVDGLEGDGPATSTA